jgi:predicted unusual protein kinase regulating ubiquinone biosynthesis (AarF/ABC1/UbiB family)
MKGTINAIMDEEVECFPRELDLRIEARHLKKQRLYQKRHGLDIAIPIVIDELSSSSVLTQTFLTGTTMGNCDVSDPLVRQKAIDACKEITRAIGVTLFRERFFHADPHPGNIMLVGEELKPGLIDFGQCTTLTKPQLRTVCQLVVLLRTRSQTLIDQALRGSGFGFNTEDPELKLALLYYFFDSSTTGSGVVRPEAMEILKDAIQHKPASMPVLTDTPREMVFYGRVCGTLRKSFEKLNADVSAVTIWYPEARKALQRLNAENPDPISSALLLLPENPDGLTYLVERAPVVLSRATEVMNSVGGGFSSSSEVGRSRALLGVAGLCAAMWYLRDALLVGMVAFSKLFLAGVAAAVVAGASPLNAVRALKGSKRSAKAA